MKNTTDRSRSSQLYQEACEVLPGGISRNTIYRTPHPDYVDRGHGCYVTDVEGTQRIDFANNMCSLIHGHSHHETVEAVTAQLKRGTAFTLATEPELRFAQHLCSRNTSFEKIRFMNSGTEAVMSGIKAARAITGRPKIAKSEGAYHGTYDYAEVSQKSNPENWGAAHEPNCVPVAAGTPTGALNDVIIFPFNDVETTLTLLDRHASELAAVLIDPLPHRVGLVPATVEFMRALRNWTKEHDVLLMMDEVITFRMGYGGAQDWFDVEPDLTALGKIIGGGFPVGGLAGRREYMSALDPSRPDLPFPHSGTFSANPITMTAGLTAMQHYDCDAVDRLNKLGALARRLINDAIEKTRVCACVTGAGSMFRIHLRESPPVEYRSTFQDANEVANIKRLVDYLYHHGLMMINTCTGVLSTPMTTADVEHMVDILRDGFREVLQD